MNRSVFVLLGVSCGAADEAPTLPFAKQSAAEEGAVGGAMPEAAPAPPPAEPVMDGAPDRFVSLELAEKPASSSKDDDGSRGEGKKGEATEEAAPARSWFPETFLFRPLVATDAEGRAEVPVLVPDRLTTWRVLGLAHSREGGIAGDVTSFLGTLPVYVDPVAPHHLFAGDRVRLPVQVVNTTEEPVTTPLSVEVSGAATASAAGSVTVPPGGSRTEWVDLRAARSGTATLKARIGATDAVERGFPVRPTGRLVEQSRGGTLAAPRQVELVGSDDMDPGSARVRLLVYPGALAILRSELAGASDRGPGAGETAYALMLAGRGGGLLKSLGEKVEGDVAGGIPEKGSPAERLRTLGILAGQRAIRLARAPGTETAALLAEAALGHPENPVLVRLGDRLVQTLAVSQRPDGTFGGESGGWTLQRMLVATADAVRAARAAAAVEVGTPAEKAARRRMAAQVENRASGAFERYRNQVVSTEGKGEAKTDGYTAAAILASGAVDGETRDALRARVRDAVVVDDDGGRRLPVQEGVLRADGAVPTDAEATALAILALEGDPDAAAWLPDLGAGLLGSWRPASGWGDGRANLVCLQAVMRIFRDPMPSKVAVVLEMDGAEVARGALDGDALREVATIEAPAGAARGSHEWTVRADPPVPGLGFSLSLLTWVPWERSTAARGIELSVDVPGDARVGREATVSVQAAAPAGMALVVTQELPAGVQVDEASLAALVAGGTLSGFEAAEGFVRLDVPALDPGETLVATYRVVPTLAGELMSGAASAAPADRRDLAFTVPPERWVVRP